MAKTAISRLLIGLTALALLAPVTATAQQSNLLPPAGGGQKWKYERDHHRDHGRDRDRKHRDRHEGRRGDRDDRNGHDRNDRRREWSRNDDHNRRDWGSRGADNRADNHDWGVRRDKRYGKDFYRGDTPAGSYRGDWSAWRDPGNGVYTYGEGDGVGGDGMKIIEVPTRNGPKVLGVAPGSFEGACDRSGGVCIIRPSR